MKRTEAVSEWKMVPTKSTEEMNVAGCMAMRGNWGASDVYAAMLSAAPQPAVSLQVQEPDAELRSAASQAMRELLTSAPQPTEQEGYVRVPVAQLQHWAEYWNGSANERAMSDALEHILGEVADLLSAKPTDSGREG